MSEYGYTKAVNFTIDRRNHGYQKMMLLIRI